MRLPENEQALQRFFNDPVHGLFKGPWVQVKRPFRLVLQKKCRIKSKM